MVSHVINLSIKVSVTHVKNGLKLDNLERDFRVFFCVFELFSPYSHHPEPGALTGLSHAPNLKIM